MTKVYQDKDNKIIIETHYELKTYMVAIKGLIGCLGGVCRLSDEAPLNLASAIDFIEDLIPTDFDTDNKLVTKQASVVPQNLTDQH